MKLYYFDSKYISLIREKYGHHFANQIFKLVFLYVNNIVLIQISLFFSKCPVNNNLASVEIMTWRRSNDKPLSE